MKDMELLGLQEVQDLPECMDHTVLLELQDHLEGMEPMKLQEIQGHLHLVQSRLRGQEVTEGVEEETEEVSEDHMDEEDMDQTLRRTVDVSEKKDRG